MRTLTIQTMTSIWLQTLISVTLVSLVSFIGAVTISLSIDRLRKMLLLLVSFAAGSLIGDAFLHLLPEAYAQDDGSMRIPLLIITGIVVFFALEKFLHWRHCHIPTTEQHRHPVGLNNLIGDGFHNLLDGMIIAGAFLVDTTLGVATTLAVILHEIPQEIGDFSILIHAGYTKKRALFFNVISAIIAILGAVIALTIANSSAVAERYFIPLTIGGFIYIVAADLIPELKREEHLGKSAAQLGAMIVGIGLMALLLVLE